MGHAQMNIRRRVQWERVKRGGDTPPLTTLSVPPMFLFTRQKKTCTQLSQAAMGHYETENSPPAGARGAAGPRWTKRLRRDSLMPEPPA